MSRFVRKCPEMSGFVSNFWSIPPFRAHADRRAKKSGDKRRIYDVKERRNI